MDRESTTITINQTILHFYTRIAPTNKSHSIILLRRNVCPVRINSPWRRLSSSIPYILSFSRQPRTIANFMPRCDRRLICIVISIDSCGCDTGIVLDNLIDIPRIHNIISQPNLIRSPQDQVHGSTMTHSGCRIQNANGNAGDG